MTNNADRAQDEEINAWERVNRPRTPAPTYKPGDEKYGPEFCSNEECGDLMPENRRAMGACLCTECKSTVEQRAKRRY